MAGFGAEPQNKKLFYTNEVLVTADLGSLCPSTTTARDMPIETARVRLMPAFLCPDWEGVPVRGVACPLYPAF